MTRIDAIYARQSVEKADSISIESQIELCQYEARGGAHRVYQDKGYSGKNTERPQLQELLKAIRRGEIRRVICYRLDRISRSILDFATMMDEFQRYGVEFVSCTESFDTSTPMGRAMLSICIVFAQLERETIQERVTDAYNARSRKGFYMGGRVPYGYRLEPHWIDGKRTSRYVIDEEEAEVIRLIYSLYAEPQVSCHEVVKQLHQRGIRNQRLPSGCWDRARIAEMIKNPIYVRADLSVYRFFKEQGAQLHNAPEDYIGTNGCYLYAEKTAKRKTVSLEKQHLVVAPHEGIVPADIWLRARLKCLNGSRGAKPLKASNTWLAGKIKCARCGYALTVRKARTSVGRYFICSRHMQTGDGCAGVGGLYAYEVENAVLEAIQERLKGLDVLTDSSQKPRHGNAKIDELNLKVVGCQAEIEKLMDKLADADDILTDYIRTRVKELDTKKKDYRKQIGELEPLAVATQNVREITGYMEKWEELSVSDKMAVVDVLIGAIRANENNIEITWKF